MLKIGHKILFTMEDLCRQVHFVVILSVYLRSFSNLLLLQVVVPWFALVACFEGQATQSKCFHLPWKDIDLIRKDFLLMFLLYQVMFGDYVCVHTNICKILWKRIISGMALSSFRLTHLSIQEVYIKVDMLFGKAKTCKIQLIAKVG